MCRILCSPGKNCQVSNSNWRNLRGKFWETVSESKRPSSSCRSPKESPVSMRLEPGVMRELHWHATAAEWAFVLKGHVRTTVINPAGQTETNDFEPGDIWYFPRGHA